MEVFTKLVSFIRVARGGSHRMVSIRETEAPEAERRDGGVPRWNGEPKRGTGERYSQPGINGGFGKSAAVPRERVDVSNGSAIDHAAKRKIGIEGGFWRAARSRDACYFVLVRLGHRGVHVLANEDEKLAFFSESRPRVPALVPRSRESRWQ
jgi:hypothetical protein